MANRNKIQQRRLKNNRKASRELDYDDGWTQQNKPHRNKTRYDRKNKELPNQD